jgi:hypothetical protein
MNRHLSSIPRCYAVAPSERYMCKYCGGYIAIARFAFHRCR